VRVRVRVRVRVEDGWKIESHGVFSGKIMLIIHPVTSNTVNTFAETN